MKLGPSIMLDLETVSTEPNAAIMQIGATTFDENGQLNHPTQSCNFNLRVSLQSALFAGLHMNPETVEWWKVQDALAKSAVGGDGECVSLLMAVRKFSAWYHGWKLKHEDVLIWSHGASFDIPVLKSAFNAVQIATPWHYRSERCTRTLFKLAEELGWNAEAARGDAIFAVNKLQHDAYWDAVRQSFDVITAYKHITEATTKKPTIILDLESAKA